MTVATFNQNNFITDTPPVYKTKLDGNMAVLANIAQQFSPHAAGTPNMTVSVDAGSLFLSGAPVTQTQQITPTFTAPTANSRIDRVVINATTGAVSVVTGTQATAPTAPAIPAGFIPVCQVLLTSTTTAITNTMITDERTLNSYGEAAAALASAQAAIATEIARAEGVESSLANSIATETTRAENAESLLAPINSATLLGMPTAPTPAAADNSTRLATTAWVTSAIAALASAAGFLYFFGGIGSAGYIKFPSWLGGWLVQWGGASILYNADATTNYPIAFPNSVFHVFVTGDYSAGTGALAYYNATMNGSNTSFITRASSDIGARFFAVGH